MKPHRSPTQYNMYDRCPAQFQFRYLQGIKIPPSGAMKQSGVAHLAYERNYKQKADSTKDLPLDEMTDYFRDTWEQQLQREEVVFEEGETKDALKDQGVKIVAEHHNVIAPKVMPVSANDVERKIVVPLKAEGVEFDLIGVLDVIDDQTNIRDNKSVGRMPNPADLAKDFQLSVYSLLYRLVEKKVEKAVVIDAVVKNKTLKAVSIPTTRNREALRATLNTMGMIEKAIQAEAFPMRRGSWVCQARYCGYWDSICPGGRRALTTIDMGASLEQQLTDSLKGEKVDG
jgi:PD-(D/E)XK nuclease superfamily protein